MRAPIQFALLAFFAVAGCAPLEGDLYAYDEYPDPYHERMHPYYPEYVPYWRGRLLLEYRDGNPPPRRFWPYRGY